MRKQKLLICLIRILQVFCIVGILAISILLVRMILNRTEPDSSSLGYEGYAGQHVGDVLEGETVHVWIRYTNDGVPFICDYWETLDVTAGNNDQIWKIDGRWYGHSVATRYLYSGADVLLDQNVPSVPKGCHIITLE